MPNRVNHVGSIVSGRGAAGPAAERQRNVAALGHAALEALEQRRLLSCTVVQDGAVLHIIGDEGDDALRVHDAGGGRVAVTCLSADGEGKTLTFEGVARIRIDTGAGNDTVEHVAGPTRGGPEIEAARGARKDTFFDLFASLSVDLGRGDDRLDIKYDARTAPTGAGRTAANFDVAAGEGDDAVAIGLLLPAVQKVREAAAHARIDLGAGADRLDLSATAAPVGGDEPGTLKGGAALALKLDAGAGDDTVDASFFDVFADLDADLGAGNDHHFLKIEFSRGTAPEGGPAGALNDLKLDIAAGDGDDDVGIGLLLPAVQKVREAAARIDLGSGHDALKLDISGAGDASAGLKLDIAAGDGDDEVGIGLLLPAVQKVREAAARIDLGAGNDMLKLDVSGADDASTGLKHLGIFKAVVDAGAGRDVVDASFFDVFADLKTDLGSGADQHYLKIEFSDDPSSDDGPAGPRHALKLDIAAGEGDDEVGIGLLLPAVQKVREAAARVRLGGGDDRFTINAVGATDAGREAAGYFLKLRLDAGAGDDEAEATFADVVPRIVLNGGPGDDRLRVVGRPLKDAFNSVASVHVLGGPGHDVLTLQLEGILTDPGSAGPPFKALVNGGAGIDAASVSEGVRVVNVEKSGRG